MLILCLLVLGVSGALAQRPGRGVPCQDREGAYFPHGALFLWDPLTRCVVARCVDGKAVPVVQLCDPNGCSSSTGEEYTDGEQWWESSVSGNCTQYRCRNGRSIPEATVFCHPTLPICGSETLVGRACCAVLQPCDEDCVLAEECHLSHVDKLEPCVLMNGETGVICEEKMPQYPTVVSGDQTNDTISAIFSLGVPRGTKRFLVAASPTSIDRDSRAARQFTNVFRRAANLLSTAAREAAQIARNQTDIVQFLKEEGLVPLDLSSTRVFNWNFRNSPEAQERGLDAIQILNTAAIVLSNVTGVDTGVTKGTPRPTLPPIDTTISPPSAGDGCINTRNSTCPRPQARERSALAISAPGCVAEPPALCDASARYRTANGSCNNLVSPRCGRRLTELRRLFPNTYTDGVWGPTSGPYLPPARKISAEVMESVSSPVADHTLSVMTWGQFIDHDLIHTPQFQLGDGQGIECCIHPTSPPPVVPLHPQCLPLEVAADDPYYSIHNQRCMNFVRSIPAPTPGCMFEPANQLNDITHWLDGSQIYGSSVEHQLELRTLVGGLMKTSSGNLLPREAVDPTVPAPGTSCRTCICFLAGDTRVNENPILTLYHTLFVREHNRIATFLESHHAGDPSYDDERLFQEARRIVIAQWQHITYNEWLSVLIGHEYAYILGLRPLSTGYSYSYTSVLNPNVANVFSTAGFRLHSLIQDLVTFMTSTGDISLSQNLRTTFFDPTSLTDPILFTRLARAITVQMPQSFDRHFSEEIRGQLFSVGTFGLDLVALNIQRGRDHGIAKYVTVMEWCHAITVSHWDDFAAVMDQENVDRLQAVYVHWSDVDLYVGINLERPAQGAILGHTARCILAEQFIRLRYADRFFYDLGGQPGSFTPDQLQQIRKTSWARILCNNVGGDFDEVQSRSFVQPDATTNPIVSCNAIDSMDLTYF